MHDGSIPIDAFIRGLDRHSKPKEPKTPDFTSKQITELIQNINNQRDEILTAFIAKYACQPNEAVQVTQTTPTGTNWWVRRKNENDNLTTPNWFEVVENLIYQNKINKGWKVTLPEDWKDDREIPSVLMLIVSELSEALEAFRKDDKEGFEEELADVMIRLLGLTHGLGIDIQKAVEAKIEKNSKREFKHGGKRI